MATPETGQYMPPAGDRRTPFSSPYYSSPSMSNAKFNPTMAVTIIVLIGGCFLLGFISVFVRKCMTADSAGEAAESTSSRDRTAKQRGLDKAAVDALPLVRSADLKEKDDLECPVCLTEFEPEDSLRLLPACKHLFHQECIDAWFDAHSTCPLCRASLTVQPGAAAGASAPAAPVETAVEVSENGDSDNYMRGSAPSLEETRTDVATPSVTISGVDDRNSARGTLSRNSQSFKRAVRGTTALEKAASLGAPGTSKLPTAPGLRKPTRTPSSTGIRRTSTDLIALRNLLSSDATNSSYSLNRSRSGVPSTSWFARPRSTDPDPRGRENWSNIDLEFGKPSTSKGETSSAAGAERAWSDRWSLASLRGAMFPLSRSSSDVAARAT